jgi:predicted DNA binding protein
MLEAIISIEPPMEWKQQLLQKFGASIVMLDSLPYQESGCRSLVEIEVDPEVTEEVLELLRSDPTVAATDLAVVSPGRIRGSIATHECIGCCSTAAAGAFLMEVRVDASGRIVQRLIATDKEAIRRVVSDLDSRGHPVRLERLTNLEKENVLTSRQEDVLQIAYDKGYFEQPKRISLRELASIFDVSISTLSEMLRKSQRKFIGKYFGEAA